MINCPGDGELSCIIPDQFCDRVANCPSGSDEVDCTCESYPGMITCPGADNCYECIPSLWVCDGHSDCPNASDEINCHEGN